MPSQRSWTDLQLQNAVAESGSVRSVIMKLGLVPAGGNYAQITERIKLLNLSVEHFHGKGWNKGWQFDPRKPATPIELLLIEDSKVQSYKLKKRLFKLGLKEQRCELCGWAEMTSDGRVPLELDHINGRHNDNRLENLRILCPNCHSLQPTHRGRNKKVRLARVL